MSANLNHRICGAAETKWTVKAVEAHFDEAVATLNVLRNRDLELRLS